MAASVDVRALDGAVPSVPVEGWAAFYDAHFDFVWRSLRRLGVPEAHLDDEAQEVFIIALRRQEDFAGRSSSKTWLFGIAYNRARELARGARRRGESPLLETSTLVAPDNTEATAIQHEALALAYRVLDEVGPERRAVLIMADVEEMTAAEIAEILAIPLNTAYSRIRLARRAFEAAVEHEKRRSGGVKR